MLLFCMHARLLLQLPEAEGKFSQRGCDTSLHHDGTALSGHGEEEPDSTQITSQQGWLAITSETPSISCPDT